MTRHCVEELRIHVVTVQQFEAIRKRVRIGSPVVVTYTESDVRKTHTIWWPDDTTVLPLRRGVQPKPPSLLTRLLRRL